MNHDSLEAIIAMVGPPTYPAPMQQILRPSMLGRSPSAELDLTVGVVFSEVGEAAGEVRCAMMKGKQEGLGPNAFTGTETEIR